MKRRLKGMEEEATTLRKMQAKVEKERGAIQDRSAELSSNVENGSSNSNEGTNPENQQSLD
ncbi:unnamed protein product [Arabidopsis arenosa]|uniref:Uncharacterized protein n=1 Tax=Arabidopsis arenosa TaxID=38785 RepID=A0A8S1ZID4_ARAAE|nr:unnamed protein product [Arabidopsis arenosa]